MMTAAREDEAAFRALLEQVARDRGFACGNYKDGCLRRRVNVRMRARGTVDFATYGKLLYSDPSEYDRLMDALTINVTRLYRDAEVWDVFASEFLPRLWAAAPDGLTVWSAGCSSGEELYTLAALLHRHAESTNTIHRLKDTQIIGTDIDAASLRAARVGTYSELAFKEMPTALRDRYFTGTGPYAAVAELRALVRVDRRDLIVDAAPPTKFDLITCRNLLIYLDRDAQDLIFKKFHDALEPNGVLLLGKVETMLGTARTLFSSVHSRARMFKKAS